MAAGKRGFRELDISVSSATPAKDRTALSHYQNLYFVAVGPEIHVYQPQFPTQKLTSNPVFKLCLPVTEISLPGYINPESPHAINHLVVGDLGNEEIVVAACDDGDVISYTTRSIGFAIGKLEPATEAGVVPLDYIRPILHRNVRKSAWGIAIHKLSRLIAISANTQEITIFAFALNAEPSSSNDPWDPTSRTYLECRAQDREILLQGHAANIPNVSFCNTEDDRIGMYLVSNDINGTVVIWRIWEGYFKIYTPQQIALAHGMPSRGRRGWNVLCLDPRSFRPVKNGQEFVGCEPRTWRGAFDISSSQLEVTEPPVPVSRLQASRSADQVTAEDLDDTYENEEDDEEDEMDFHIIAEDASSHDTRPLVYSITRDFNNPADQMAPPIPGVMPVSTWHSHRAVEHETYTVSVPFLVLTTTDKDIFLWSPSATYPATATHLANALHQHPAEAHLSWLEQFSRLNMTVQIPELGIVIIASQAGRVGLLTLTRLQYSRRNSQCAFRLDWILPFKSQEEQGLRPALPLLGIAAGPIQGQENKQDGLDRESPWGLGRSAWKKGEVGRRYRLILEYFDRTVLAYEVGRRAEGAEEVLVF
ncbi:hypothetical protein MMC13_001436 [Lambiella insularis]|nr:hypothetical protein [Lambiella insularis]